MSTSNSGRSGLWQYCLLIAGIFVLMAWLTPTHRVPWTSFHEDALMALAAGAASAAVLSVGRHQRIEVPFIALLTSGAAAIPWMQLAAGLIVYRGDAAVTSLYLAGLALATVIGHRAVTRWGFERALQALATVILISAVMSVWLALCQWQRLDYFDFAISEMPVNARPFANLNQPNLLATLLVLGLLATAMFLNSRTIGGLGATLLVAFFGLGLAMTQSRAGILECVTVGALLLARRRYLGTVLATRQLVIGGALVAAMSGVWQLVHALAPAVPAERDAAAMLELGARGPHWQAMIDAILRRPLGGYGWGQGATAQFIVAPDHPAAPGIFDYGHNLVLDLLLWNGIPVGALLVLGLLVWFWRMLKAARNAPALLAFACVVAVFAHAMVEYPLYYASFLLPVGALMGGLDAAVGLRAVVRVPRWALALVAATVLAWLSVVIGDYLRLEEDVRLLRFERARIGLHHPRHVLSEPVLLTQLGALTHFVRAPLGVGMTDEELQTMEKVVKRFPSGENIVRYASALALNGRPSKAEEALRRVCRMERRPACEALMARWTYLGEAEPKIAQVTWP